MLWCLLPHSNAVYVVVFRMPEVLALLNGQRRPPRTATGELSEEDALGYLDFWMRSLEQHAPSAPILLVGSYMDKVPDRKDHVTLSAALTGRYGPRGLLGSVRPHKKAGLLFFPLDNTGGHASALGTLRHELEAAAMALPVASVQVDVNVAHFYDTLAALSRPQVAGKPEPAVARALRQACNAGAPNTGGGVRRLSLEQTRQLAAACGIKATKVDDPYFRHTLDFLREMGSVLHFNTPRVDDLVFLDPQYLIECITCVIRDFDLHKLASDGLLKGDAELYHHFSALKTEGILRPALLPVLWSSNTKAERETLLQLLLHFDLAVPLKSAGGYIVPVLLPPSHKVAAGWNPNPPEGMLLLALGSETAVRPTNHGLSGDCLANKCFLPSGLFARAVCRLVEYGQRSNGGDPVLCSDRARLFFGRHELELALHPHYNVLVLKTYASSGLPAANRVLGALGQILAMVFPRLRCWPLLGVADNVFVLLKVQSGLKWK